MYRASVQRRDFEEDVMQGTDEDAFVVILRAHDLYSPAIEDKLNNMGLLSLAGASFVVLSLESGEECGVNLTPRELTALKQSAKEQKYLLGHFAIERKLALGVTTQESHDEDMEALLHWLFGPDL
jgi:hypothetical protein